MMQRPTALRAWADVQGDTDHPMLQGRVTFLPHTMGTLVVAEFHGLPPSESGFYGFHIHEGEQCGGNGFSDTRGHYNPGGHPHPLHAGDLPPLLNCGGKAYLAVISDRFRVKDILGKTVVIHSGRDDFRTQPAGDAGSKIACGIIRRSRS